MLVNHHSHIRSQQLASFHYDGVGESHLVGEADVDVEISEQLGDDAAGVWSYYESHISLN